MVLAIFFAAYPFVFKSQPYQTIIVSTDLASHSKAVDSFAHGQPFATGDVYLAPRIFGVILGSIQKVTHLSPVYLFEAFMVVVLAAVPFALYALLSYVTKKAWVAVLIVLFCNVTILALYSYGTIFDVLNMAVILPLAMLFMLKWLNDNHVWQLVISLSLLALFGVMHLTGIYLPVVLVVVSIGLIGRKILTKEAIGRYFIPIGILSATSAIALLIFSQFPYLRVLANQWLGAFGQGITWKWDYIQYFVTYDLTVITVLIAMFALYAYYTRKARMSVAANRLLWILGAFVIALGSGLFFNIAGLPVRILLDMGIIVSMMIGVLAADVMSKEPLNSAVSLAIYCLTGLGVMFSITTWVK